MNVIETRNLTKIFDLTHEKKEEQSLFFKKIREKNYSEKLVAIKDVNIEVKRGECLGIIGKNGSGKTTLLKLITGVLQPTSGEIIANKDATAFLEIGLGFEDELTGRENVFIYGSVLGFTKKEIEKKFDRILEYAGIEKFVDVKLKNYSSGMKMRLAFATAMMNDPDVLLIDEILSIGDKAFQLKSFHKIKELKRRGKTMILVSHSADHIAQLCERSVLLEAGKVIKQGKTEEVTKFYLENIVGKEKTAYNKKIKYLIENIEKNKKIKTGLYEEIILTKKRNILKRFSLFKLENSLERIKEKIESQKDHLSELTEETLKLLNSQVEGLEKRMLYLKKENAKSPKQEFEEKITATNNNIKKYREEIIRIYQVVLDYSLENNELVPCTEINNHIFSGNFNDQEMLKKIILLKEIICKTAENNPALNEELKKMYLDVLRKENNLVLKEKQEKHEKKEIKTRIENDILIKLENPPLLQIGKISSDTLPYNHLLITGQKNMDNNILESISLHKRIPATQQARQQEKEIVVKKRIQEEIIFSIKQQIEDSTENQDDVSVSEYNEILFDEYKNEKDPVKRKKLYKELINTLNDHITIEDNTLKTYGFYKELIKTVKYEQNLEKDKRKREWNGKVTCHKIREFIEKIENDLRILFLKKEKLQKFLESNANIKDDKVRENIKHILVRTDSEVILKKELIKRLNQKQVMLLDENIKSKEVVRNKGYGSHEAEILNVEFLNSKREKIKTFYTGEKFIARLNYFAYEKIKKPQFGIAIHTDKGFQITGPNTTLANQSIDKIEGKGYVDYIIDSLPLLNGNYLFTAAILNYNGEQLYDYHYKKFEFSVINNSNEKFGTVVIPSRWEYKKNPKQISNQKQPQ